MSEVLYFKHDLALVTAENSMSSQLLAGAVQGTNQLYYIINDDSYVQVSFEVAVEYEVK